MDKFHPSMGVRCFYVRGRHGEPVGLVMTRQTTDTSLMAWSLCNRREDVFRKTLAKAIAWSRLAPIPDTVLGAEVRDNPMNRALTVLSDDMDVPQSVRSAARRELERRTGQKNF